MHGTAPVPLCPARDAGRVGRLAERCLTRRIGRGYCPCDRIPRRHNPRPIFSTLALDRMLRFRSPESTGLEDLASLTTGLAALRRAVRSVVRAKDFLRPSTFLTSSLRPVISVLTINHLPASPLLSYFGLVLSHTSALLPLCRLCPVESHPLHQLVGGQAR